jgi:hypothetical protein
LYHGNRLWRRRAVAPAATRCTLMSRGSEASRAPGPQGSRARSSWRRSVLSFSSGRVHRGPGQVRRSKANSQDNVHVCRTRPCRPVRGRVQFVRRGCSEAQERAWLWRSISKVVLQYEHHHAASRTATRLDIHRFTEAPQRCPRNATEDQSRVEYRCSCCPRFDLRDLPHWSRPPA